MKKGKRYEVRYIDRGAWRSAGSVDTEDEWRILARATRLRLGYGTHDRRVRKIDHYPSRPAVPHTDGTPIRGRVLGVTKGRL